MEKKSEKKLLGSLAVAGILLGGLALSGCDDSTSSKPETAMGILSAKTLATFQTECTKVGGMFLEHDCAAMNDCKGHSYLEGEGVAAHDCKGMSSCKGGSCIES
ncbi:MAG: hypothetical protein ABI036_00940 [Fibrobacteria bacterium]